MNEKTVLMSIDRLFNTRFDDGRMSVILNDDFILGFDWPNQWTNDEPEIVLLTNLTIEEMRSGKFEESVPIVEEFELYDYFETPNDFADKQKRMKLANDIVEAVKRTDVAKVKKEWLEKPWRN